MGFYNLIPVRELHICQATPVRHWAAAIFYGWLYESLPSSFLITGRTYIISSWAGGVGTDSVSCVARKVDAIEVAERCSWGVSLHGWWPVFSGPVFCASRNSLQRAEWYLLISLSVAARGGNLTVWLLATISAWIVGICSVALHWNTENSDNILFATWPALLAACWVKIPVLVCITTEDNKIVLFSLTRTRSSIFSRLR
jgi:hypothetical protein